MVTVTPLQSQTDPPNFLLVLVDDLGIEHVETYGLGEAGFAPLPEFDRLAAEGILFSDMWSAPLCSPSRAMILTGRLPHHTGVGVAVAEPGDPGGPTDPGLPLDEITLPEILRFKTETAYLTAAFGKWHLGVSPVNGGIDAPNLAGFEHFEGTASNLVNGEGYFNYTKITNGVETPETQYVTSATVDWTVAWINEQTSPWFAYVAFHAPHIPYHWPPEDLHTQDTSDPIRLLQYRAAAEAADNEIARLLASIDTSNTMIFYVSDNGSPWRSGPDMTLPPVPADRGKSTLYQGGVRVPSLITADFLSTPSVVETPASITDLYATIADYAGATFAHKIDGRSLRPALESGVAHRGGVFAELHSPNGHSPTRITATARNARYKLMRKESGTVVEFFYDLLEDPWESQNLLPDLTLEQMDGYNELSAALDNR